MVGRIMRRPDDLAVPRTEENPVGTNRRRDLYAARHTRAAMVPIFEAEPVLPFSSQWSALKTAESPPELLGAVVHVDASRPYNPRALAETPAEEHSYCC